MSGVEPTAFVVWVIVFLWVVGLGVGTLIVLAKHRATPGGVV